MQFNPNNEVVKLCAAGMELEGQAKMKEALQVFQKAWVKASNDFEKFTAAHYIARHQNITEDKLLWDTTALNFALKLKNDSVKGALPSLYLNIAKCYEDLSDFDNARINYENALSYANLLPQNGYGNMIKGGIMNGISRIQPAVSRPSSDIK